MESHDASPLDAAPEAAPEARDSFRSALFFLLFAVSLTLPNLVYSGTSFFQTLHLMKWCFALVPVGLLALCAGGPALLDGERGPLRLDVMGLYWLLYLVFVTLQPLWVPLRSVPGWRREWFFFAGCVVFYLTAFSFFRESWLRPILWLAALNAAINGIFAELQVRDIVAPLWGMKLVMQTPGHYIGNTGQQNMFALWLALALFSSLFLFVCYGGLFAKNLRNRIMIAGNLLFYVVMSWCLIRSTSRSGILAFWVGALTMALMIFFTSRDRGQLKRAALGIVLFFGVLGAFVLADTGRGFDFLLKTRDMIKNIADVAARREIWQTSWQVGAFRPLTGVGLGQFKWHYLQGQRVAMTLDPAMKWQFTYWAHNEILQWFCEFGLGGVVSLLLAALVWLAALCRYVRRRRGRRLPMEFLWGSSFLFLVWFDALWTRPFHRIENSLWVALAFALCSRHLFWGEEGVFALKKVPSLFYRLTGAFMLAAAVGGFWFGIDGVRADRLLRRAESFTDDAEEKVRLISAARHSPMVRDLAEHELAMLRLRLGEKLGDREIIADGLNRLIACFVQQPTARDFATLMDYARRSNIASLLEFLEPYAPPAGAEAG